MTNKKSTRRSLLMSALAMLLCVSMLIGSTFAWFTDSVTSGNNKIVAGNLDVELEYRKVVGGQLTDWKTVKGATEIFDPNALWEPGRVEVVYLKVSNLGTLALKYQLGVNVSKETPGINVNNEPFKLSDHLVFKTVEMPDGLTTFTDRQAVQAVAGTEKGLMDYNGKTTALEAKNKDGTNNFEDYVALIVYMPETVGNEANYKTGTDIPTIELGVNLYATQYTAEDDSFGPDYDENAWADGMKVYDAEDLLSALATEDKVILVNDIATTDVIKLTKDVAINLNGKTLSASLEVSDDVEISLENGTITNANKDVSGIQINKGNVTLTNVEISSARHAVRVEGGTATINGGIYKAAGGNGMTQHALNVSDGSTVIINGGTFIGPNGTSADSGSAVNVQAGSTVVINGGNFSGGKNSTLSNSGTLTVKGGAFDQNPANYVAADYKAIENNGTYYVVSEDVDDVITNAAELQAALDAATGDALLVLAADITGNVFATQKEGVNITIDGNNFKYDGTIEIRGQSRNTGAETLTIKNINFVTDKDLYFVECNSTESAKRYAHNVTIQDCTFTNNGNGTVVPARFRQCYNITMKGCTVNGTFSPLWATGCDGLTVDNVIANCTDEGITVGTSNKVVLNKCDFTVTGENGFGVRADASGAYTLTVTGCTFNAKTDVILRSATSADYIATVDGKYLSTPASVQKLIDTGITDIVLMPGEYGTIVAKSNITIEGTEGAVVDCINLNGADNVTLKGITFDAAGAKMAYDGKGNQRFPANIISGDASKNGKGTRGLVIDGCAFTGAFADGGMAIAFNDQSRGTGQSGNITIKGCTFETTGGYVDIYTYYSGYGEMNIEGNTFASVVLDKPIYLGRYQSGTPVVVKGNTFENVASFEDATYIQDHGYPNVTYGVSFAESNNTFAN